MRTSSVTVLGSANVDFVVEVERRPQAGETLMGSDLQVFPGGKGANQAAAAARAGADTRFLGSVGHDDRGAYLCDQLAAADVDVSGMHAGDRPTGVAMILLTPDGENSIVVSPGANHAIDLDMAERWAEQWSRTHVLVMNLEVPLDTVRHVAARAHALGVRVVLNAAPSARLDAETLAVCDPLIVNEHEAAATLGYDSSSDFELLARELLAAGARSVVITLGADGALFTDGTEVIRLPAHRVRVVDTTGAGDAFVGATACELSRGASLAEAVRFAIAMSALSVQHKGAQSSYVQRREVEAFLRSN